MNDFSLKFDDTKEIEAFYDFHNAQVLKINTLNTNVFLEQGKLFDIECENRVDEQGRVRIIYIADKIQPLSAILQFVSNPFVKVKWGIYAIIVPPDLATLNKIAPIISYGLGITGLKNKFTLKVFEYKHRDDLTEVIKWMDDNMVIQEQGKIETGDLEKKLVR